MPALAPRPRGRTLVGAVLLLVVSACSSPAVSSPEGGRRGTDPTPTAAPATFTVTLPVGGVDAVLKREAITVRARGGVVDGVDIQAADGSTIPATPAANGLVAVVTPAADRTSSTVRGVLAPNTAYRVTVRGHNANEVPATTSLTFTTNDAPRLQASMSPGDGQVVGVGMPVLVRFTRGVPDRAAAQRHLRITTTPAVPGSWGWVDDTTAVFRPRTFWPAGTRVSAAYDAEGAHLGGGRFGGTTRTVRFTVGRDLRMTVSNATHTLVVTRAGRPVRTLPVSLGRPGHATRSGTKIVYEKHTRYTMRGDASDPYVTTVAHAQRITDSGEFLHAAPWSVGAQGRTNVSHGCTNLSPAAASWLYDQTLVGDPVVTTGTTKPMPTWDGISGVWNYTPTRWARLSAL